MVKSAFADALPPGPLHVKVKVELVVNGPTLLIVPDVACEPLHPPDATHEVAPVELQFTVTIPPDATLVGIAVSVTLGGGGES